MASSEQQHGIVGSCEDCDGQMVEVSKFIHDGTGTLTLKCQGCGAKGRIDYAVGEEQPWKDPSVQEGVVDATVKQIHWIDCPRCDGHKMIEDPLCDLRRAMNGREHPCPRCDFTGKIPRVVETDGGNGVDDYRFGRLRFALGKFTAAAICRPQRWIGRRRHDNHCDKCGDWCGNIAMEKMDFPFDTGLDGVSDRSKVENILGMFSADYRRFCLSCGHEAEQAGDGDD
ncbi:hypothetical protein [Haloarcula onubensis]|uniref:Uncharacterized protein n=1 Tax=Haloarcula onubensis TaxID=2950539 RepID=A0ABU2FVB5_9EURY|nr:hypothetical protein [Halomicroarcula sp. S3CR25-11]MDS0284713.1 hypothetical protein [Halomicroarcula sp. S3CR25-11]